MVQVLFFQNQSKLKSFVLFDKIGQNQLVGLAISFYRRMEILQAYLLQSGLFGYYRSFYEWIQKLLRIVTEFSK